MGYVKADTAVVDEMFRTDELNQYLSRMNLTPRWEDGIFDRLVSGEVTGEEPAQSRKGCRIWQLSLERLLNCGSEARYEPVSYTHLDVYKRQAGYHRSCPHGLR